MRPRPGSPTPFATSATDGSWPTPRPRASRWVDGYHTGYVLDALLACRDAGIEAASQSAIDRGLEYYRASSSSTTERRSTRRRPLHPIDIQCVAQGIQTFALASRTRPELLGHARLVFDFARADDAATRRRLRLPARPLWTVATPHVRWAAAPMLLALTHLLRALATRREDLDRLLELAAPAAVRTGRARARGARARGRVTARDHAQTVELARERWPDAQVVGRAPRLRRARGYRRRARDAHQRRCGAGRAARGRTSRSRTTRTRRSPLRARRAFPP